ncbi:hypothetical protein, partial [Salinispora arenicola]|uniref:hypothetical protein n=1 Tax=Salinispora arenicola TaxID=168697 RepID=UPI0028BEAFD2
MSGLRHQLPITLDRVTTSRGELVLREAEGRFEVVSVVAMMPAAISPPARAGRYGRSRTHRTAARPTAENSFDHCWS